MQIRASDVTIAIKRIKIHCYLTVLDLCFEHRKHQFRSNATNGDFKVLYSLCSKGIVLGISFTKTKLSKLE